MGRLLVLGILLAIMVGLRDVLGVGGASGVGVLSDSVHDPLVLAAIGFVVLASYSAAQIGAVLSLPRVTGYITAGLLLGPSAGNVLSARVVQDMTMFNTLALGLIATGAGLELDLTALRALLRTLLVTVSSKIVFAGGLVFGGFVALEHYFQPLGLMSMSETIAVGLVLGTLAIGTSPAIALALINETRARGRLADLTLGAAVLKDLVLVVLLAIVLAVCAGLLGRGGGEHSIPLALARELGGSVAIGALLGLLIIAYVRFVRAEMLLFVAGLVLAASELSRALHLDLLLVFIAAGFVVRNFSHGWEEVHHAIETVALPVFVVFFTIAGARIDAQATLALLPAALVLALLRAIGFFIAARIGAHAGRESDNVRRLAWQAYLPQAGVTLSLLGLAVEAFGPDVGGALSHIGIACVAVNLMVGPVTLRRALQLCSQSAAPELAPRTSAPLSVPAPVGDAADAQPVQLATGSQVLDYHLEQLYEALVVRLLRLRSHGIVGHARSLTRSLWPIFDAAPERSAMNEALRAWSSVGHGEESALRAQVLSHELLEELGAVLEALPVRVRDPIRAQLLVPRDDDGRFLRFYKLALRVRMRLSRAPAQRRVRLRDAAQITLGPQLTALAQTLQDALCRQHGRLHSTLLKLCRGEHTAEEAADIISSQLNEIEALFAAECRAALHTGFGRLVQQLDHLDSPARDQGGLLSHSGELDERAEAYRVALSASEHRLLATVALTQLSAELETVLEREVLLPLAEASDAIEPAVNRTRMQLREALSGLRRRGDHPSVVAQLSEQLQQALTEREQNATSVDDRFRAAAAMHALGGQLRALIDTLPSRLSVLSEGQQLQNLSDPAQVSLRSLDLRTRAQRELGQDFIAVLDHESRQAAAAVKELDARVVEAQEMALSVAGVARSDTDDLSWHAAVDSLELALNNLQLGTQRARAELIASHDEISDAFEGSFKRLERIVQGASLDMESARQALARPLQLLWARLTRVADAGVSRALTLKRWLLGNEGKQPGLARPDSPQLLRALFARPLEDALPPTYARLFRIEPSEDLRHNIVRESELDAIIEAERCFNEAGPSSILILGDPGSGRTTLLNRAQLEITVPRLLRPEAARSRRREGLIRALAYELRCPANRAKVTDALRAHRTAVLVDDLEQWHTADASGVAELRALLSLIRQTRKEVFWVVTAGSAYVRLMRPAIAIEKGFGHVMRVAPLELPELQRAIEQRHALSGLTLVTPELLGKLPGRIVREFDRELAFSLLHSLSGGNPSAALSLWCSHVRVEAKQVHIELERLQALPVDYARVFDAFTTAILVQMLRFGPLTATELTSSLGVTSARLQPHLVALLNAGLVEEADHRQLFIVPSWRAMLATRLPANGPLPVDYGASNG